MSCPLCDHQFSKPSWNGSTFYRGREFTYSECLFCSSSYCDPMPDGETLSQMYGADYQNSFVADAPDEGSREGRQMIDLLKKMERGMFVDYGCGAGSALMEAAKLNWRAVGVEFDEAVAAEVEKKTGLEVLTHRQVGALNGLRADVLHLGDVIEHLTEMNRQMPEIVNLIRPGGLLVAQGPLEANLNLFTLTIRLARSLRRRRRTEMAPYHVPCSACDGEGAAFVIPATRPERGEIYNQGGGLAGSVRAFSFRFPPSAITGTMPFAPGVKGDLRAGIRADGEQIFLRGAAR
jgi:SAM-dependent methyltransferase